MTAVVILVDHRLPICMCYQEAVDRTSTLPPRAGPAGVLEHLSRHPPGPRRFWPRDLLLTSSEGAGDSHAPAAEGGECRRDTTSVMDLALGV